LREVRDLLDALRTLQERDHNAAAADLGELRKQLQVVKADVPAQAGDLGRKLDLETTRLLNSTATQTSKLDSAIKVDGDDVGRLLARTGALTNWLDTFAKELREARARQEQLARRRFWTLALIGLATLAVAIWRPT
jgi:hypothetical protein